MLLDHAVRALGQRLVDRAVDADVVRSGVTGDDVFELMNAAA